MAALDSLCFALITPINLNLDLRNASFWAILCHIKDIDVLLQMAACIFQRMCSLMRIDFPILTYFSHPNPRLHLLLLPIPFLFLPIPIAQAAATTSTQSAAFAFPSPTVPSPILPQPSPILPQPSPGQVSSNTSKASPSTSAESISDDFGWRERIMCTPCALGPNLA